MKSKSKRKNGNASDDGFMPNTKEMIQIKTLSKHKKH
jgi:hypothetical protein